MSDLVRVMATAFRNKGAIAMPGADLRFVLAFGLRWFAPEDAKRVVARAIEVGLLVQEGDTLRVTFDPAKVDVPVNFRPSAGVFEEDAPSGLPAAPEHANAVDAGAPAAAQSHAHARTHAPPAAHAPPADAAAHEERARRGGLVSLEAAALVVARRRGEDVTERARELEARILKSA
jgi:hypothetical protein